MVESTELQVARIRDAAALLRVTYLPVMNSSHDEDWRQQLDVAEQLADLLGDLADVVKYATPRGSSSFLGALTALVDKLEAVE